jgi:hypothetical protein
MKPTEDFMDRAKMIARQVIDGSMSANDGCVALANINEQNGWPSSLSIFSALAHEQTGHEHLGFNPENTASLIVEECRRLLDNE